jgi:hypothetical protein
MKRITIHRGTFACILIVMGLATMLAGCGKKQTGEAVKPPPSGNLVSSTQQTPQPALHPTVQATPTLFVFGPFIDPNLDLKAGPEDTPLELQIPALKVDAPISAVGITSKNVMDAPKGDIGDPIWHTAFWYRGGGIPGDVGTATIAGHVNDPLGRPEIFANLQDLKPGDLIIIHLKQTSIDIRFIVDEIKVYSVKESSTPQVLTRIYGAGPVAGTGPQPSADGLAHLTLITCAGTIINGEFDHHTVVYATRSK